jgi:hypothetical protein
MQLSAPGTAFIAAQGQVLNELAFGVAVLFKTALVHRPDSGHLDGPSVVKAASVRSLRNTSLASNVQPELAVRSPSDKAAIFGLHLSSSPNAVVGFVVSVDVDALNCQIVSVAIAERPIPENREIAPFSANGDASTAVIFVAVKFRISASSAHVLPALIKPRAFISVSASSGTDRRAATLAAAGLGLTVPQISPRDDLFGSAFAAAQPKRTAPSMVSGFGQYRPKSDLLPGHVDKARVSCILCHANDNTYVPSKRNRGHG